MTRMLSMNWGFESSTLIHQARALIRPAVGVAEQH